MNKILIFSCLGSLFLSNVSRIICKVMKFLNIKEMWNIVDVKLFLFHCVLILRLLCCTKDLCECFYVWEFVNFDNVRHWSSTTWLKLFEEFVSLCFFEDTKWNFNKFFIMLHVSPFKYTMFCIPLTKDH